MIFDSSSEISETQFSDFLSDVKTNIDLFSDKELEEIQKTLGYIEHKSLVERAKKDFLAFVKLVAPTYKTSSFGQHHKMASMFEESVDGDKKRVAIAMPPRFSKSSYASIFLPAWAIGKHPDWKIMQISATEDLATDFGRKVKAIIDSPIFQEVFPGVKLTKDAKANSKFAINKGGEYFALGLESHLAGKGGDLLVCLTGDQPVYGLFKRWNIRDLVTEQETPMVITRGRFGLPEIRRVKASCKSTTKLLTTVTTNRQSSTCTPNHPFFVEGKGMTRADNLIRGDKLVSLRFPRLVSVVAVILTLLFYPARFLKGNGS